MTINPYRVYAESCILHCLGELHGDAERRLREVDSETLSLGERWLDCFLGDFSIAQSTLDFIPTQWEKERAANPELTPEQFARDWAGPIFGNDVPVDMEPE